MSRFLPEKNRFLLEKIFETESEESLDTTYCGKRNGRPYRDALFLLLAAAAVVVAATVVVAAAVVAAPHTVTATAGEQNDQNDDPPAVVIAHKKYLRD